jgi:hypothetical protein
MKSSAIDRARNYLRQIPPAIEGSGGNTTTFNAVVVLIRGFRLSDSDAMALLLKWNATCQPPWPERDLRDKIKSAHKDSRKPYGYLLNEGKYAAPLSSRRTAPRATASPPATPKPYTDEELAEKAGKQARWNPLQAITIKEVDQIAVARACPIAGPEILAQAGLIMADKMWPGCYVLTHQGFRQYRRIDGTNMPCGQKSQNAPGSHAKGFFGLLSQFENREPDDLVFVVEGPPGLLEAVSMQWLCAPHARRWKMLAAHSAFSRFFYEPVLLKAIAGRHCRILPDAGKVGTAAAKAWRDELRAVGCRVDFATLPDGFQDMKKLLAAGSDGLPAMRSILAYPRATKMGGAA